MAEQLTLEQMARLARAKVAELEERVRSDYADIDWLTADMALAYELLARLCERQAQHG